MFFNVSDVIVNNRLLTCYGHQVEPHGLCSEWVGLHLVSSSLEEHWPGLGCIPGDESEKKPTKAE